METRDTSHQMQDPLGLEELELNFTPKVTHFRIGMKAYAKLPSTQDQYSKIPCDKHLDQVDLLDERSEKGREFYVHFLDCKR